MCTAALALPESPSLDCAPSHPPTVQRAEAVCTRLHLHSPGSPFLIKGPARHRDSPTLPIIQQLAHCLPSVLPFPLNNHHRQDVKGPSVESTIPLSSCPDNNHAVARRDTLRTLTTPFRLTVITDLGRRCTINRPDHGACVAHARQLHRRLPRHPGLRLDLKHLPPHHRPVANRKRSRRLPKCQLVRVYVSHCPCQCHAARWTALPDLLIPNLRLRLNHHPVPWSPHYLLRTHTMGLPSRPSPHGHRQRGRYPCRPHPRHRTD